MTVREGLFPSTDPVHLYSLHHEFLASSTLTPYSNFLKGVKWSPDGVSFLTAADDNWLRIYDLPPEAATATATSVSPPPSENESPQDPFWPALRVHAGELIYDYCWYSHASAADPATCCFAVTSRSHPIHLYDGCTGEQRCSYRAYNDLDELSPAYSIAFGSGGSKIFAGGKAVIHIFDVSRPGRDHSSIQTFKRKQEGQPGIISSLAFAPDDSGLMAAGSYSGVAALYDIRTVEQLFLLEGHTGGVTHVEFSADGNYLYTGARRDGSIYCWDARNASGAVYTIQRDTNTTNQRIYFDIEPCGRHLATGGEDGWVRYYDLRDGSEVLKFCAAADVVNGCEFHPFLPFLATSSGQRRFGGKAASESSSSSESESSESEGDEDYMPLDGRMKESSSLGADENVLRVWKIAAIEETHDTIKESVDEPHTEGHICSV